MRVVPKKQAELTGFYATHLEPWRENASAIGLSEAMVTMLEQRVAAARAAAVARDRAKAAAEAATQAHQDALDELGRLGAGMMAAIRLKAQSTDDRGVYQLARIPAPQQGSPVEAPGMPYAPRVMLGETGAVMLSWQCKNPKRSAGTMYEVRRQVNGGAWEPVATSGRRAITDTTLPAGAAHVIYQVRAVRSTRSGRAAQFTVKLSPTAERNGTPRRAA